jgi:hypothetical protein
MTGQSVCRCGDGSHHAGLNNDFSVATGALFAVCCGDRQFNDKHPVMKIYFYSLLFSNLE